MMPTSRMMPAMTSLGLRRILFLALAV
jgi:hypothetical protein